MISGLILSGLLVFAAGPAVLALDDAAMHWWINAAWVISAAAASLACVRAVLRSDPSETRGWVFFTLGCATWFAASLYWGFFDVQGRMLPFPSLADAGYVLASWFIIVGIYHYASLASLSRVQLCNLGLVICAVCFAGFEILQHDLAESDLSIAGKVVALAYAGFWCSAALFGLISLALYTPPHKRPQFALIVAGTAAQAVSDVLYSFSLMNESYQVGTAYDAGWVVGFGLIALGAARSAKAVAVQGEPVQAEWQKLGEALVPVLAAGLVLVCALLHGLTSAGAAYLLALPPALAFAILLGVRENEITRARQRQEDNYRSLMEFSPQIPWTAKPDGGLLEISPRWQEVTGQEIRDALGQGWADVVHPHDQPKGEENWRRSLETATPLDSEERIRAVDGSYRWIRRRAWPRRDANGQLLRWYGTFEDIHDWKMAEQTLHDSQELAGSILRGSPNGLAVFDLKGRYQFMNGTGLSLAEIGSIDEIRGRTYAEAWPADPSLDALFHSARAGEKATATRQWSTATGKQRWWEMSMVPLGTEKGEVQSVLAIWRDVTERKAALDNLEAAKARLTSVLESTTDSVLVLDPDWRITFVNRNAVKLVGGGRNLAVGENLWDVYPEEVGNTFDRNYRRAMEEQVPLEFEEFLPAAGLWLEVHAYPAPETLSIFFRDVTERKRVQERLAYLARHDHLTGLINRFSLGELLDEKIGQATPDDPVALLYMDLDDFKEINDTLGHAAGDVVLREVAGRLASCAGESGAAARLGGDEFAMLISPGATWGTSLPRFAEEVIRAVQLPIAVDGGSVQVGASVGVVTAPLDGAEPDQLLRNADISLYFAKSRGKGTFQFFDPSMAERLKTRHALKADLRTAIEANQLTLVYQPIVDIPSGSIRSFEALLRWHHPERGLISPAEFIPLAEETGLIVAIGEWVLKSACSEAMRWPDGIGVAVNLSPVQFQSRTLPLRVADALARSGLDPGRLELEVTESVLLQGSEANIAVLRQLRELGVRIALDDFGTGYSSLSYLNRFPFDKIKIDRSFMANIIEKPEAKAIVRSVTALGHSLGMRITAEGIETPEHLELVRDKGCDEGQGYYFGRPVAPEAVEELLASAFRQPQLRAGE